MHDDCVCSCRLKNEQALDDSDEVKMQSALDLEDAWQQSSERYQAMKTPPSRALDKPLVLVAKTQLGANAQWMLPARKWEPGETMRQVRPSV